MLKMFNKSYKLLEKTFSEKGISNNLKKKVFKINGLNLRLNSINFKSKVVNILNKNLKDIIFGKNLINENNKNKKFLINLNNFKGLRHKLKKPVRGQRTRTNAKTSRKVKLQ
jgi:small subunit ribosomal protein S13